MLTPARTRQTILYSLSLLIALFGFSTSANGAPRHHDPAAAGKPKTCTLKTFDVAPTAVNGEDFGNLQCSRPFGRGVQHNTSTFTLTGPTTGKYMGSSRMFFATGTVRAKFALDITISGSSITFSGTAKVIGGTGSYKGITGSAKLKGSSTDGGTHSTITETIRVKLP
jgi:hypothetical protein